MLLIAAMFVYQTAKKDANRIFPLVADELDAVSGYVLFGNGEVEPRFGSIKYAGIDDLHLIADGLNALELVPQNKVTSVWPEKHEQSLSVHWKNDEKWLKRTDKHVEFYFVDNDTVIIEHMGQYTYYTCDYSVLLGTINHTKIHRLPAGFAKNEFAEIAAETFVQEAYVEHLRHNVIWRDSITNYTVLDWGINQIHEDKTAVTGWVEYAFTPVVWDSPDIWAGNISEGKGEYEGMLIRYQQFALEKQADSTWICIEIGTGGVQLSEER